MTESQLPSNFQIDVTRFDEFEAILAIARNVKVFDPEEIDTVDELLCEYRDKGAKVSGYHFLTCRNDGHVLGFACYGSRALTEGAFDLYWIATDKVAQGQGVGAALLRRVAQEIKALDGRLIVAETSGRTEYAPTRRFYEMHDYERAATITDFYAPGDDLVIYVQRL